MSDSYKYVDPDYTYTDPKTGILRNLADIIDQDVLLFFESGAVANQCVVDGMVKLNGIIEGRKRAKIRVGDEVQFEDTVIKVVSS